jgi:hypothetical protein
MYVNLIMLIYETSETPVTIQRGESTFHVRFRTINFPFLSLVLRNAYRILCGKVRRKKTTRKTKT